MSRHNLIQWEPSPVVSDLHTTIDRMLRSGILKVYPLPLDQGTADARFNELLDALAARSQDDGRRGQLPDLRE